MKRTPDVDLDKTFEVAIPITKAYVDQATGERHIVGVASGVAEDRDGERVSKNGVRGMVRDVTTGAVKLTGSHQQDWMSEIGDVVKAQHDDETDEFIVDSVLPPEGTDPLADKAWRTANREKVGFSVGGKLIKSFFEKTELGKKRKVLDAIKLRHIMLTKHPAYPNSFAEAVAKTWDGEAPADEEFTLETDDEVEKDTTGTWASGDSDSGGGRPGRDSVGSGQRNAGERRSKKGMSTEDDGSDDDKDDDQELPKAKSERHLACPNCGHEFAADLPVDPEERQVDETNDKDDDRDTGKSVETEPMSTTLGETLDSLKALADGDVDKTSDEKTPEQPVEKDAGGEEELDVAKMLAASHRAHEDHFAALEEKVGEGFELIAKSHKQLVDAIEDLPRGRRSKAQILPPPTGHDGESAEKTVEQEIEEADTLTDALKVSNRHHWGVGE